MPFVVAGTIARNRAWVLGKWGMAMERQTRRPDAMFVLLNDCTDASEAVLDVLDVSRGTLNTGETGYERTGTPRYSTANLAYLRNEWMAEVLTRWPEATHLWSCDSDVIPDADVLARLLDVDRAVVAAVVRNSDAPVWNFWRGLDEDGEPRRDGTEAAALSSVRPVEVSMTGACVLIRRDACGVKWAPHDQGEDVAWSCRLMGAGKCLYLEPGARTLHFMRQGVAPLR